MRSTKSISSPELGNATGHRRWRDRGIVAVLIAYLTIGALYSLTTPSFEAGDELWHYPFVKHLADGKGLPSKAAMSDQAAYRQEGAQPPLYYILGALATAWIDTGPEDEIYKTNPHASTGEPLRSDNKNMVMHGDWENFPFTGAILALHLVRLLSVVIGAGTVYLTYLVAKELFPGEPFAAIVAAVFIAFLPEFLFLSGSVNNDNLVILLCTAAVLLIIRLTKGNLSTRGLILLSAVIGLATLSKLSGLALLLLVGLVAVIEGARKRTILAFLKIIVPVASVTAVISGWWYLRNWMLFGDPLGLSIFLKIVGERFPKPGLLELLADESEGIRLSFWGVFGGFNVLAPPYVYLTFDVLAILALSGLLVAAIYRPVRKRFGASSYSLAIISVWVLIIFVSFLRWTHLTLASQGRLMYPALGVISAFLALGLCSLATRRFTPYVAGAMAVILVPLAISVPFSSILPAYPGPTYLSEELANGYQRPLEIDFEGQVKLLGVDVAPRKAAPGDRLEVSLYLRSLARMPSDYSLFVHVFSSDNTLLAQIDSYPGRGSLRTSLWKPGTVLKDTYSLTIPKGLTTAGVLRLEAGLYDRSDMRPLRAFDPAGKSIGTSPIVAQLKLIGPSNGRAITGEPLGVLDGRVALQEYQVENEAVSPGNKLRGSLTWRSLAKPERDYTVFVQLVGAKGLVAQYDSYPRKGAYPTSFWDEGELIDDTFEMAIDPAVPEGEYDLLLGMYDAATGNRLPAGAETFLRLQKVHIRRGAS